MVFVLAATTVLLALMVTAMVWHLGCGNTGELAGGRMTLIVTMAVSVLCLTAAIIDIAPRARGLDDLRSRDSGITTVTVRGTLNVQHGGEASGGLWIRGEFTTVDGTLTAVPAWWWSPSSSGRLTTDDRVSLTASGANILLVAEVSERSTVGELHLTGEVLQIDPAPEASEGSTAQMRQWLVEATRDLPGHAQGLVPGVAVGQDGALSEPLAADFRVVSLTHITAVSGSHIVLVTALVNAGLSWMNRRIRLGISLVLIAGLLQLVLPEPSVQRAAMMAVVVALGQWHRNPRHPSAALWVAVLVLLSIDPTLSRQWGFALSVSATTGLICLTSAIAAWFAPLPVSLRQALAVPVAAQLACTPVLLALDPALALFSVPSNVIAAPALAPLTVGALTACVLSPWWPGVAHWIVDVSVWFTAWIAATGEFFAHLPGARLPPGAALIPVLLWAWRRGVPLIKKWSQPANSTRQEGLRRGRLGR